jgi:hypothetical protein
MKEQRNRFSTVVEHSIAPFKPDRVQAQQEKETYALSFEFLGTARDADAQDSLTHETKFL